MSTRLATPINNAARMMLGYGVPPATVQIELNKLKQPSEGLVYLSEVVSLIDSLTAQGATQ